MLLLEIEVDIIDNLATLPASAKPLGSFALC
jgi:hypothetical protein